MFMVFIFSFRKGIVAKAGKIVKIKIRAGKGLEGSDVYNIDITIKRDAITPLPNYGGKHVIT